MSGKSKSRKDTKMKWDDEQLTLYEILHSALDLNVRWKPSILSDDPGPRLTDEAPNDFYEEQDMWTEHWEDNLRERYGIKKPFAD